MNFYFFVIAHEARRGRDISIRKKIKPDTKAKMSLKFVMIISNLQNISIEIKAEIKRSMYPSIRKRIMIALIILSLLKFLYILMYFIWV